MIGALLRMGVPWDVLDTMSMPMALNIIGANPFAPTRRNQPSDTALEQSKPAKNLTPEKPATGGKRYVASRRKSKQPTS